MTPQADQAHFAPLAGAEFIVLTTYRRNGVGVPTPVWFAHVDGVLYVTTGADAGKVKRLRANPVVQVAVSDRVGTVLGPAISGRGRVLERDEDVSARTALQQKYGAQFTTLTAQMDANRPPGSRIYLVIVPT